MQKATLGQRKKLWKIVEEEETSQRQLKQVLESELFSDLLRANFGKPIDRSEFRKLLGLKPPSSDPRSLPIKDFLEKCDDPRLKSALEYVCTEKNGIQTIGALMDYVLENPMWRWEDVGGKTILLAQKILRRDFDVTLPLTEKDWEFVRNASRQPKLVKNKH